VVNKKNINKVIIVYQLAFLKPVKTLLFKKYLKKDLEKFKEATVRALLLIRHLRLI